MMEIQVVYTIYNAGGDQVISSRDLRRMVGVGEPDPSGMTMSDYLDKLDLPQVQVGGSDIPLTILLECAGSMRGIRILAATAALRVIGNALHAAGRPFEILGHTTQSWKGGQPAADWKAVTDAARQNGLEGPEAGRLNALRHIVLKDMDDDWNDVAREDITIALTRGVMKENIDGEALQWTASRMTARPVPGDLLIVNDGLSVDDMTDKVNPQGYLHNHLAEVVADMREAGLNMKVICAAPHSSLQDYDRIYPDAVKVVPAQKDNVQSLAEALLDAVTKSLPNEAPHDGHTAAEIGC